MNKFKYPNTAFLILSLIIVLSFIRTPPVQHLIVEFGLLGYSGAFIIGLLFVSVFTVAPATIVLFYLAREYNPLLVAVFATLGSVIGDYVIFHFLEDGLFVELKPLFIRLFGRHVARLSQGRYTSWLLPVAGAIIIASPFPDEVGIALLGVSHLKTGRFIALVTVLDFIGMLLLVATAKILIN